MVRLSQDFQIGNDGDDLTIFALYSGGGQEAQIELARHDPDGIVLKVADAGVTDGSYIPMPTGMWVAVELGYTIDSGAGNDGAFGVWINGCRLYTSRLDQAALTHARLGSFLQLGNFVGKLYFDQVVVDAANRLYPPKVGPQDSANVGGQTLLFTQSGFAFVGAGEILSVQAIDNGSNDARVKVYDTRTPQYGEQGKRIDRKYNESLPLQPTQFSNGAYVLLSGTSPQALVKVGSAGAGGWLSQHAAPYDPSSSDMDL
jgi:hypothetical protein